MKKEIKIKQNNKEEKKVRNYVIGGGGNRGQFNVSNYGSSSGIKRRRKIML